ncbi:MAG: ABC transporter permease [Bosea sp. (in: a-proteobacteria)]|jgi:ribose transport system permease protein|uniref:ABC transporter permease n=1 Tax=unclassified Bosea (in: a-proteobacteria) TaxID=2653178 RepID=UPI00083CE765|nr:MULTISPECIES: ABC transporter permease [unclassified Bosea (in: a-proteobacteria)]AOG03573.1 branched-chain amino acid transport system / permease component family protein [Bosea sp. RAC05]MBX9876022.1 ABC transporter permease [Beijerinckiaceae bacterium]MDP3601954.1 ABC transporter permease [Bosea sp. (in: a-proteobacteria)]WRH59393.1 MAG: ABC transporter permease [Bosea sp. (in: a-proteobacteria)]
MSGLDVREVIGRYGTAIAGLALVLFFLLFAPNFASTMNIINVLKDTSFLAILALGFALAFTVAELDLSIAEMASLAAVVCGWMVHSQYPPAVAFGAAIAVGIVLGSLNGYGVTVLRIPSLIMTLGTAAIAKGLAFMITQGVAFTGRWPVSFTGLARGYSFGIPNLVLWMTGATLFAWILVKWTRTGAHMVATGEADEAARLAGIATARMKRIGLLLAGVFAGLMAALLAANLSSAAPNMAGDYLLYAIAAVLLGMTMFEPGKPNIAGTVFAALVLKVLGNGLVLLGAPYYIQDIVLGVIIIGSVAFSASAMKKAAFKV